MADLNTIKEGFNTKKSFQLASPYKGVTNVGFVGDEASIGGQRFSSPEALYSAIGGGQQGSSQAQSTQGGVFGGATNYEDTIRRAIEMQREAAQPAISSMQAGIPEVQQKFATTREQVGAEVDPLKARYDNLLADVRASGQKQEQAQTRVTSQELGKRGLVGSSTLAQQELLNATQPIQESTQRLATDVGLSREESLRGIQDRLSGLTTQETGELRAIQNAIAQLQAGAGQSGISTGTNVFQNAQSQQLAQQQLQSQQEQLQNQQAQQAIENALRQRQFEEVTLPSTQYQLNQPYYKPEEGGGGLTAESFRERFGGSPGTTQTATGFNVGSNVISLLAQGKTDEALALANNP